MEVSGHKNEVMAKGEEGNISLPGTMFLKGLKQVLCVVGCSSPFITGRGVQMVMVRQEEYNTLKKSRNM